MNEENLAEMLKGIWARMDAATQQRNTGAVARWHKAATECEALQKDFQLLLTRFRRLQESLENDIENQGVAAKRGIDSTQESGEGPSVSAKAEGAAARAEWVKRLHTDHGIDLIGHGKSFTTVSRAKVGIAYANELPVRPDRWFLGLRDELLDIVVLLCRTREQELLDLVLPVKALGIDWRKLPRSESGQVLFHVRKDGVNLCLLVPPGDSISITKCVGHYEPLRDDGPIFVRKAKR